MNGQRRRRPSPDSRRSRPDPRRAVLRARRSGRGAAPPARWTRRSPPSPRERRCASSRRLADRATTGRPPGHRPPPQATGSGPCCWWNGRSVHDEQRCGDGRVRGRVVALLSEPAAVGTGADVVQMDEIGVRPCSRLRRVGSQAPWDVRCPRRASSKPCRTPRRAARSSTPPTSAAPRPGSGVRTAPKPAADGP
jgi:hypothetical protein